MKTLKIKVAAILFSMVGLFAMSTQNIQANQLLICDTQSPNQDPDGPGPETTECKAPILVECCVQQDGAVIFFGREQKRNP